MRALEHAQARERMHVRSRAHAQARSGTHANACARSSTRSSTRTKFVCALALYDEEEEVTKTPYENYA